MRPANARVLVSMNEMIPTLLTLWLIHEVAKESAFSFTRTYRQPGLLCTPQNFAQTSKFLVKKIF
jgi:hypothetical protein